MKKLFLILLLLPFILGAAPSRTKTYTSGEVINPSDVTENEDNLFRYVQTGVDTYADSTIVSADITDGTIVSADIADSTIVNADISTSAAIAYSKLSLGSSIVSSDITDSTIVAADIGTLTTIDINGGTIDGITSLTAGGNLDIGSYEFRAQTFNSDVATGTAPFTVSSTTKVTNLNADTIDGVDGAYLAHSQLFTSDDTFTAPAGVTKVYVSLVGGGGGGGGSTTNQGGGGGGGATMIKVPYTVIASNQYVVDVGDGGAGGASNADGSAGSNSTFDSTGIICPGGAGGIKGTGSDAGSGGAGGSSGNASGITGGGVVAITGGSGSAGTGSFTGGAGGGSALGKGANNNAAASANTGGGGGSANTQPASGNSGGSGIVIVEW